MVERTLPTVTVLIKRGVLISEYIPIEVSHCTFTALFAYTASSTVSSKHEELESLYSSVGRVITEGLTSFEKASTLNMPQLQCTLLILKAACNNDSTYIDR